VYNQYNSQKEELSMTARPLTKTICVVPYDGNWPLLFQKAAALIAKTLGDTCVAIHHIGSTAVPGLAAKPEIDMLIVVKDLPACIPGFETLGARFFGQLNIPGRLCFSLVERDSQQYNLHVVPKGHPHSALFMRFRDFLIENDQARARYGAFKEQLVAQSGGQFEKHPAFGSTYTLAKHGLVQELIAESQFDGFVMTFCHHDEEWAAAARLSQQWGEQTNPRLDDTKAARTELEPAIKARALAARGQTASAAESQAAGRPQSGTKEQAESGTTLGASHLVLYHGARLVAYAQVQPFMKNHCQPLSQPLSQPLCHKDGRTKVAFTEGAYCRQTETVFLELIDRWLGSTGAI
jgi:GrpB-like predicted nucleotidyltransferase (UPF0157 family)